MVWGWKGSSTLYASYPELLMHLLTAADPRGRAFRNQIRAYNSALAFRQGIDLMRKQGGADVKMVNRAEGAPDP